MEAAAKRLIQFVSAFAMDLSTVPPADVKKAFSVSAYPNAPLINFTIAPLDIQAATVGTIADAKDWKLTDNAIHITDGSTVQFLKPGVTPAKEATAFDRPVTK